MRGGRLDRYEKAVTGEGSSPHARRQDFGVQQAEFVSGFISACAEAGAWPRGPSASPRVHLRMRGGRQEWSMSSRVSRGSSPHARRQATPASIAGVGRGFISACAEAGARSAGRPGKTRVHLRMRGGRGIGRLLMSADWGSSPHARRQARPVAVGRTRIRFISACAEAGGCPWPRRRRSRVHLRMRGGRRLGAELMSGAPGSSPHARRQGPQREGQVLRAGFISACAEAGIKETRA